MKHRPFALSVFLSFAALCSLTRVAHGASSTPILFTSGEGIGSALVVGAWNGSKWLNWEKAQKLVKARDRFRFISQKGASVVSPVGKPVLSPASGSAYTVTVGRAIAKAGVQVGLPASAHWNVVPRPVAVLKPDASLAESVAVMLKQKGVAEPKVEIAQAKRCDLDGDGTAETIFEARSPGMRKAMREGGDAVAGQFSIIALRQSNGTVTLVGGEFRKKGGGNAGPPQLYELTHLLDLDGDGKMEIVASTSYYEGGGAEVYTWDGKKARKVLSASDGA